MVIDREGWGRGGGRNMHRFFLPRLQPALPRLATSIMKHHSDSTLECD